MALDKSQTDENTDRMKRRRVGFSWIDVGVEANDCINIYLIGSNEQVGLEDNFRIDPIDLNQFFDGKIFGYKDLKINIYLSSISFHAYADMTFQSTFDGGKGITDLKPALQKIFGESLVDNKDDFFQTFSASVHYVSDAISKGEILHREASNGDNSKCGDQLEGENFIVERQVVRMAVTSMPVGELYCRLVPLALLLIDGSSPIDITDPSWQIYFAVESKKDDQGGVVMKLLGFAAVYRFYYYPESSRLQISQILVLPPYQGLGHGRLLLEVLNSVAISENVYDITVEEPSDYLQQVRSCIDVHYLLDFKPVKEAICSVVTDLGEVDLSKKTGKLHFDPPSSVVDDVRTTYKINKKQFLQCWEILVFLSFPHIDYRSFENYMIFIAERTKEDVLGKDPKDSEDAGKQIVEVPNDYDHEMTFVMFRPTDNVKVDNINPAVEENLNNWEEHLNQLAEGRRINEILEVALKVVRQNHRASKMLLD